MNQKELNKTFMMISNLIFMIYAKNVNASRVNLLCAIYYERELRGLSEYRKKYTTHILQVEPDVHILPIIPE